MSRRLFKCLCRVCGSSYEIFWDESTNEHICKECVEKERFDKRAKEIKENP